jgi:integrase
MAYAERNKRTKKLTGRWIADAQWSRDTGVRLHKAFPSKAEAEAAEAFWRIEGRLPAHIGTRAGTFREIAERYRERYHAVWLDKSPTNRQRFDAAVAFFGDMDIAAIDHSELERWIDHLRSRAGRFDKPPANRTLLRYLDAANHVFDYALRDGRIKSMPIRPLIPNEGATRQAISVATERDIVQAMIDAGHEREAFYVTLLSQSGMRCGEVDKIVSAQIEMPERIEHTGVLLKRTQTKSKRDRWVPLLPETARKFYTMKASGIMPKRSHVYDVFKATLKKSGDAADYCLHSLRHTTATRLNEVAPSTLDVADILGHSTGLQTQNYNHARKAHLFSVVEKAHRLSGEMDDYANVVPLFSQEKSA